MEKYQNMLIISYRLIKQQGTFLFVAERNVPAGISLCQQTGIWDVEGL
jgi:hypothetical protein